MKTGFCEAMEALQDIQYGDQKLEATVQHNKAECEQQLGDVIHMVLALKVSHHLIKVILVIIDGYSALLFA